MYVTSEALDVTAQELLAAVQGKVVWTLDACRCFGGMHPSTCLHTQAPTPTPSHCS